MRRILRSSAVLFALAAAPAVGQDRVTPAPPPVTAAPAPDATAPATAPAPASLPAAGPGAETPFIPRLGLGLGIDALSLGSFFQDAVAGIPAAPVSIYLPLQVLPFLRLDPSFGAGTYTQNVTGGSPYSGYVWTVGLGVLFYVVPPFPFGVYLGPRVSLSFSGTSSTDQDGKVTKMTELDVAVLAAFGAEFFFVRQFGIGAELRLGAYIFGNPTTTTAAGSTTLDRGRIGFATSGVFFLRYFFY